MTPSLSGRIALMFRASARASAWPRCRPPCTSPVRWSIATTEASSTIPRPGGRTPACWPSRGPRPCPARRTRSGSSRTRSVASQKVPARPEGLQRRILPKAPSVGQADRSRLGSRQPCTLRRGSPPGGSLPRCMPTRVSKWTRAWSRRSGASTASSPSGSAPWTRGSSAAACWRRRGWSRSARSAATLEPRRAWVDRPLGLPAPALERQRSRRCRGPRDGRPLGLPPRPGWPSG